MPASKGSTQYTASFKQKVLLEVHASGNLAGTAKKYGVPKQTVQHWRNAEEKSPSTELVQAKQEFAEDIKEGAQSLALEALQKLEAAVQKETKTVPLLNVLKESVRLANLGSPNEGGERRDSGVSKEQLEDVFGALFTGMEQARKRRDEEQQVVDATVVDEDPPALEPA